MTSGLSSTVTITRPTLRERAVAVPVWIGLVGLVAAAFLVRVVTALAHSTPRFFPDEYIYASLGRALSHGSLEIRGQAASFPALLEPLLAAPLWRLAGDDIELGYRLVQGLHALAAALTAVPVYLIARRLGLSARLALACAAITLVLPAMVLSALVTAETVALPLALGAVLAAIVAIDRPTWQTQVAFLGLAGLATFARVQYVVLVPAFLVAAAVVERRDLRGAVRAYGVTLAALGAGTAILLAAGTGRALGYYRGVTDLALDPAGLGHWAATDAMLLVYASGLVLVPGALAGLALGVARPRSRVEQAFAVLVVALAALLLLEAAVYASNGSQRFQERYLVALLPLVPVAFCLGMRRAAGRAGRTAIVIAAAGILLVAMVVPVAGYTALDGNQDSPFLHALTQLEQSFGSGSAALLVALAAGALALVAAAVTLRPQLGTAVALAAAFAVLGTTAAAATAYDLDVSDRIRHTFVGTDDPRWVDAADVGPVSILQTPHARRQQVSLQLFYNSSIDEILRLGDTTEVDAFGSRVTRIADDGTIVADGEVVRRALLVQEYASWAQLEGAVLERRTVSSALWRPDGTPRMAVLLAGRYLDGWLGAGSQLTVWPGADGPRRATVELTLSLPTGAPPVTVDVSGGGVRRPVRLQAGRPVALRLPVVATRRPVTFTFTPRRPLIATGNRPVAALATPPHLHPIGANGP